MAALSEVLELLYRARGSYRSARGVLRHRSDPALWHVAARRRAERLQEHGHGGGIISFGSSDDGSAAQKHEEVARFWYEPPGRLREEFETLGPTPHAQTIVKDGPTWWAYTPDSGAMTNAGLPDEQAQQVSVGGGDRFLPLLDPSGYIAALDFDEPIEQTVEIGRPALRVCATPRLDHQTHSHPYIEVGVDAYELSIDRQRGVLLRVTTILDQAEVSATWLEELAFDETFPPDTFAFTPPPGEQVHAADPNPVRTVALSEATQQASFPLFLIPVLPEGPWRMQVNTFAPPGQPANLDQVHDPLLPRRRNRLPQPQPTSRQPRRQPTRNRLARARGN